MRGHIKKRGKNSYSLVFDLGYDSEGHRKQKWITVHGDKKKAQSELVRILNELNTGTYVEPKKMTFAEYLQRWISDYASHSLKPRTFETYQQIIEEHITPYLGMIQLTRLQPLHLQDYYAAKLEDGRMDGKDGGLAAGTVLNHHRLLHKALATAVKWGLVGRNVADAVEPPQPHRKEGRMLTQDEARRFLAVASQNRLYALFLLAMTTGMRQAEIVGLRWHDVDMERRTIAVQQTVQKRGKNVIVQDTKTASSRRLIPISKHVAEALKAIGERRDLERAVQKERYCEDYPDLVFVTLRGTPISGRNLVRTFKTLLGKAGLPDDIRFHDLRHTSASLLLAAGVHPKVVSERLGHSGIRITMDTYSHFMPTLQEGATATLDDILFPKAQETSR
ncbi:MAG: site-specific integrase [Ignavibacteriales bacterium]